MSDKSYKAPITKPYNKQGGVGGNQDSKTLAKDWRAGKGNTASKNFTTPKDRENPKDFKDDLAKDGEPSLK